MRVYVALLSALMLPGLALAQSDEVRPPEIPFEDAVGYDADAHAPEWYRTFTLSDLDTFNSVVRASPINDFGMEWQQGERWTFNVRMRQRIIDGQLTETDQPAEEMTAGASFNLTPRISVGGAISVGSEQIQGGQPIQGQDVDAGVRLRSAFKF